jgi:hypothetical protein
MTPSPSLGHMKKLTCLLAGLSIALTPPALARGGLGEIFGALVGKAAGKIAGYTTSEGMSVEQALVQVCDQVNKQLPMAVDRETRWDNTTPGPGRRFTYNYTFVNATARDVDLKYFYDTLAQKIRNSVCTNKDMAVFFQYGVTVSYSYRARDGAHVGKIDITPRDCSSN